MLELVFNYALTDIFVFFAISVSNFLFEIVFIVSLNILWLIITYFYIYLYE